MGGGSDNDQAAPGRLVLETASGVGTLESSGRDASFCGSYSATGPILAGRMPGTQLKKGQRRERTWAKGHLSNMMPRTPLGRHRS
jgi:hypothetical protein